MKRCLIILTVLFNFTLPASAAILTVATNGSADYSTIQAALNVANDGDVVQLAPGTYYGAGNTNLEFYDDVTVRGTGDPDLTIVNCYGSASSPRVAFNLVEETGGTVENLTIRRAWGDLGGAVITGWGHYVFRNCKFLDNHAQRGGAWYGDQEGTAVFENCIFAGNTAETKGGALSALEQTNISVQQCTFTGNSAPSAACIHIEDGAGAVVENSIMAWNLQGGDLVDYYGAGFTVSCSDFFGNQGGDHTSGSDILNADPRLIAPWDDEPNVDLDSDSPCREDIMCGTMGAGAELDVSGVTYIVHADGTGMTASIQDAVNLVQASEDEIVLEDGVFSGPGNHDIENQGRSFTVRSRSNDPAACMLIPEGGGTLGYRHFLLTGFGTHTRLRGIGFHGGSTIESLHGGALKATQGCNLTVSDCYFRDNSTWGFGGALFMVSGTLVMDDTVFEFNTATDSGGAIHTWDVLIQANVCRLESNFSEGDQLSGWRMDSPRDESFLMEVDVGNHQGIGIYVNDLESVLNFTSCTFWDNETPGAGAGLRIMGHETADAVLTDCEFNGNLSGAQGGGVYTNCQLSAFNCDFLYNEGSHGGGLCGNYNVHLDHCTFTNNTATDEESKGGGAAMVAGWIENCTFEQNVAYTGGGLHTLDLYAPMSDCIFRNNQALNDSGGAYATGELYRCSFLGNTANAGAGAYLQGGEIHDSIFWNNTATQQGSALIVRPEMLLTGCTFASNTSLLDGGGCQILMGFYVMDLDYQHPTMERCIVAYGGNSAGILSELFGYQADTPLVPGSGDGRASHSLFWANNHGITNFQDYIDPSCILDSPPQFCDLESGDLTLHAQSPALPSNNEGGVLMGSLSQGCGSTVDVVDEVPIPTTILLGNFPNPFNPMTTLEFNLAREGFTIVEILNLRGQRVAVLVNEELPAGPHTRAWDGRNEAGQPQSSGVYLARLITAGVIQTHRMALVR